MRPLAACPVLVLEAIFIFPSILHLLSALRKHKYSCAVEWWRSGGNSSSGNPCFVGLVLISLDFDLQVHLAFRPWHWFLPFTLGFDTWLLSLGSSNLFPHPPSGLWSGFPSGSEYSGLLLFPFKARESGSDPNQILGYQHDRVRSAVPSAGKKSYIVWPFLCSLSKRGGRLLLSG